MRIVELRAADAPLRSPMKNAVISFTEMTCSIVALVTDVVRGSEPIVGYGFSSNGRYAATCILRERFIPRILATPPEELLDDTGGNLDPFRIWSAAMRNEKPGGHGERSVALGALDMAVWDAVAKIDGVPLWSLLSSRFAPGRSSASVFVYAAGGYYGSAEDDLQALRGEFEGYLALGYTMVKMKIGGASLGRDLRRIEAALGTVGRPDGLAVDANARFDEHKAFADAEALAPYGLAWFEEPVDPLDFELLSQIAGAYGPPLATGENLFSAPDARNLLRYGGLRKDRDVLQFDCALSYGLVEYLRILQALRAEGWSQLRVVPHGGHQMSLHVVAGLGLGGSESYPGLFAPFGGFADNVPVIDGRVSLPELPGIGIEAKADLHAFMASSLEVAV
jgi:L-alanine-DL-glutamate epimerase-like enolase superfamily enzyme